MNKDFWRDLFRPSNGKMPVNLVLGLIIGIFLLISSKGLFAEPEESTAILPQAAVQEEILLIADNDVEVRAANILSQINGAGQVEVMVTFKTATEHVVATEERTEEVESNNSGAVSQSRKQEVSIVLTEDGKGNRTPIVLTQNTARVEGVVIVAEGGDQAVVKNALTSAAQALFDVPVHKIVVLKMK